MAEQPLATLVIRRRGIDHAFPMTQAEAASLLAALAQLLGFDETALVSAAPEGAPVTIVQEIAP